MNITKSTLKLSFANLGSALVTFGGIALFARLLTPGELGMFFLFEALVGMLFIPADFGIRGALEKRISEGQFPGQMLTTAVLLKLMPLTLILAAILLAAPYINRYIGSPVAIWLAVALICHELYQLSIQVLAGELRVGETAVLRLAQKLVWLAVGVVFVEAGYGFRGLIFGLIAGYMISFAWGMVRRSTPFGQPSIKNAKSLVSYSQYNFISAASGYFYSWMDVLLIGLFLTTTDVGAYEAAWRVTAVTVLGSQAIAQTIFPQVSRWDADQAIERIESLIPTAITPSLALVVPAFFGTLLFSRQILTSVFGPDYAIAWLALIILMGEKVFQAVHSITGRSLKAIDQPALAARAAVAAIILNFTLNIPLIITFGIAGAAVATALSFMLNTAMCIWYLSRFLVVDIPWRELAWVLVSSCGMTVVLFGLRSVLPIDNTSRLVLAIALGVVVYTALALAYEPLRTKTRTSLQTLLSDESQRHVASKTD